MRKYSFLQSGISLKCDAGSSAPLGTMGGLSSMIDGAFTLCFDFMANSNGECVFLSGEGTGTRDLLFTRNVNGVNADSIQLASTDASGDVRSVTWNGALPNNKWGRLVFVSSAAGADNLNLYVNNVLKTITSQTNDAGFNADESFDMAFGQYDANKIQPFSFTSVYIYDRALTEDEIEEVNKGVYPEDYVKAFPFYHPNIGVDKAQLTPVIDA